MLSTQDELKWLSFHKDEETGTADGVKATSQA